MNNFNIEELIKQVKKKNPKKILLQLPEGLKTKAVKIIEAIEKQGIEVILSADPCYGACDLPLADYGCDLIVHVGHTKFIKDIKTKTPVLYFPWEIEVNLEDIKNVDFSVIKEKRIGLITTIQHLNVLPSVFDLLKKSGKEPLIGGQILGCWTENADKLKDKVDAFLFVGSGRFHPLGIKGKTYVLDFEKKIIEIANLTLIEKKRYARIAKAKDAKSFAILVSIKPGQFDIEKAERIKKNLEEKDKKAFILIMNEISNEKLYFGVDAFINTACPRLVNEHFDKPIINVEDLKEVLR